MKNFSNILFPEPNAGFIRAKRTPLLFNPIIGSSEQFIVGVVACDENSSYLTRANKLEKLNCLYGEQAAGAIFGIELSLDELALALEAEGSLNLFDYEPAVSGLKIGSQQEVEGVSLREIADSWMASMSSLFVYEDGRVLTSPNADFEDSQANDRASDRLGQLLLEYIAARRPNLKNAFSAEIRSNSRRRRGSAHGVFIDFAGAKVVANFGILSTSNYSGSIDRIKRRMWDLKVFRDDENSSLLARQHEMIVQHPSANDPSLSQRQLDKIMESIHELEKQADQEKIRFRPMETVEQIGEHLMTREAA